LDVSLRLGKDLSLLEDGAGVNSLAAADDGGDAAVVASMLGVTDQLR
jgi:hypothetical protein